MVSNFKILFINPPRVNGYPVVREERFEHKDIGSVYPPLSLLTTAAICENAGYDVDLIDANGFNLSFEDIKKRINNSKPDMVFMRIGFDTQESDLKTAKIAKANKVPFVVLRNNIISQVPALRQQLLIKHPEVDIFVNSEPESVILNLTLAIIRKQNLKIINGISYKAGKKIINNPLADEVRDLDKLPMPSYHLLPNLKAYYSGTFGPPFATILGSRGCPYQCGFCAYGGTTYRQRTPESIVSELEFVNQKYKVSDFYFLDDVVTINPQRMIKVCQAIIKKKLDIRWSVGIRADSVTRPLLKAFKKAGCVEIAIGVESGSEKILKIINKQISVGQIKKVALMCHQEGIRLYAMFIIGLPGETRETILESLNLAKELKAFYTQFCFATPYPNTKIYDYYQKNKLLLTKNWSKYFPLNDKPVIKTLNLTRKDLIELRSFVYKKMLFDFKYLITKIDLKDWRWNIRGFVEILKRIVLALYNKPIR